MPLALALGLFLPSAQDGLDGILRQLSDDDFEARDKAQKELEGYLEDDAKVERLRKAMGALELDARQRAQAAIESYRRRKDGLIAFIRCQSQELWVVRPDATDEKSVTKVLKIDFNHPPAWAPDGSRMIFLGGGQLYGIDVVARDLKQLTAGETPISAASWLPDGKAIVFSSYVFDRQENAGSSRWIAMDPDGANPRKVEGQAAIWRRGERGFSPDGKRRADDFAGQISVTDLDGNHPKALTGQDDNRFPVWSPDGKWIAYSSGRGGASHVYVVDAEGRGERRITDGDGYHHSATWSPDSRRLAFVSTKFGSEGICVIDLDGKNLKRLTDQRDLSPSWSPSLPLRRAK